MDILEELRKQTQTALEVSESADDISGEIGNYQHSVLLGSLKKTHDYLHELSSKLNQLTYTTTAEIIIPEFGSISNLNQNNYELIWENSANHNRVTLKFYSCIQDSCTIGLDNNGYDKIEDSLTHAGVEYSREKNLITLRGKINSSITFSINRDECHITLAIVNFKQLGQQRFSINERLIDDNFFNQFGRFLLQRENNFIDIVLSNTAERPDQNDDEIFYDPDSGFHTQEMDVSRVRSLFNKEVQLYLTYHNSIKEINPKSGEFVIGRSRQCNITVNSDLASRQHAKIVYRKGKYVLADQSTNGTFVKTQGGKEIYVQGEELPLSGSGFISLGKSVTVDNEHIIYFSCH